MTFVPIPPPRVGDYRMDVDVVPRRPRPGLGGLRLLIRDPERHRPVAAFSVVHERLLHLFIISRSLEYFAHVHPTMQPGGEFRLKHELPPGEYVVIADFLPKSGGAQMLERAIVAPGPGVAVFGDPPALAADIPDLARAPADAPDRAARDGDRRERPSTASPCGSTPRTSSPASAGCCGSRSPTRPAVCRSMISSRISGRRRTSSWSAHP
jgi:hypothetical protein